MIRVAVFGRPLCDKVRRIQINGISIIILKVKSWCLWRSEEWSERVEIKPVKISAT
jgi:hypothetical protein